MERVCKSPSAVWGKKKEKDVFFGRRGSKYCRVPREIGGMDGMQMPRGLFESAGDDQSNATAAGGFSEGKTGGFWSFRCMGGHWVPAPCPCTSPNTTPSLEQLGAAALCSVSPPW